MRTFHLRREQLLPGTPEEVFTFFGDPRNLEAITPPWLRFAITHLPEVPLREGADIRYRLRVHGVPIRWKTLISAWEPPYRFVDEQVRGPYRRWVHTHTFEARGDDTLVRDHVEYAPLGGWLADTLLVKRDLARIFDYRRDRLEELLGRPGATTAPVEGAPLRA